MKVIHKAALKPELAQTVPMPAGAVILAVQLQRDIPTIWYRCDPKAPPENRTIVVVMTGEEMPDMSRLEYIGTIQGPAAHGGLVLHYHEAL